jgi:taurine dioxygenase
MRLSNTDESGKRIVFRNGAEAWHTDLSFTDRPSLATLLYGEAIPPEGGDTLFCDTTAAFEALDAAVKRRISNLKAVHSFSRYQARRFAERPLTDAQRAKTPDVAHPVVRVHPETGRKALFLGDDVISHVEGMISHVEGMDRTEGKALMDELLRHATEDRFCYRHRWRRGDLVVYDNRCTLHRATDYDENIYERTLLRTSIEGTSTSVTIA